MRKCYYLINIKVSTWASEKKWCNKWQYVFGHEENFGIIRSNLFV